MKTKIRVKGSIHIDLIYMMNLIISIIQDLIQIQLLKDYHMFYRKWN